MKLEAKDYLNSLEIKDLEMLNWILLQVKLNPKTKIYQRVSDVDDMDRLDVVSDKVQGALSIMLRDRAIKEEMIKEKG